MAKRSSYFINIIILYTFHYQQLLIFVSKTISKNDKFTSNYVRSILKLATHCVAKFILTPISHCIVLYTSHAFIFSQFKKNVPFFNKYNYLFVSFNFLYCSLVQNWKTKFNEFATIPTLGLFYKSVSFLVYPKLILL